MIMSAIGNVIVTLRSEVNSDQRSGRKANIYGEGERALVLNKRAPWVQELVFRNQDLHYVYLNSTFFLYFVPDAEVNCLGDEWKVLMVFLPFFGKEKKKICK